MFDIMDYHMRDREELEPSYSTQLDINGMQPHSREHLEYEVNAARGMRKYDLIEGEIMDYCPGIHFGGTP